MLCRRWARIRGRIWLLGIRRKLPSYPLSRETDKLILNSEKRLDLFPITPSPKWDFDYTNVWRLPDAHGEEIVRAVYLDEQVHPYLILDVNWALTNFMLPQKSRTVFTGGEDGIIRAWRPNGPENIHQDDEMEGQEESLSDRAAARARDKKKFKDEKRFRPY